MTIYQTSRFFIQLFLLTSLSFTACQTPKPTNEFFQEDKPYEESEFADYWYSGVAELNSYSLRQSRYGEIREGTSVMVFVTEPFSQKKQVKLDKPSQNKEDMLTVMKLNFTRKFITGIYPYSMMLSVFTPVDSYNHPATVKSTLSSQEWCGQSFTQFNYKNGGYLYQGFSYFESSGDEEELLSYAILEDEIWNRIRLNPSTLPLGEVEIIHSAYHQRLNHSDFRIKTAETSKMEKEDGLTEYKIRYLDGSRVLSIIYQSEFPYRIESWTEAISDGEGGFQKTTARRMNTIKTPYWEQNSTKYEYLRDSLNLR